MHIVFFHPHSTGPSKTRRVRVLLAVMLIIAGAVYAVRWSPGETTPVFQSSAIAPVYVIDAGHGGMDGGAVGVDGLMEKDVNLAIAKKLELLMRLCGADTAMTRESDISLHDASASSIRDKKNSDIRNRLAFVNARENPVFISIHLNKFEQEKYYGAQTFYSANNPDSKALAQAVQTSCARILDPENKREIKKLGSEVYLMHKLTCPAIILECGFLSNAREARLLQDDKYQSRVAMATLGGVCEYERTKATEGGEAS